MGAPTTPGAPTPSSASDTQATYAYHPTTGRLASVSDGTHSFAYTYLANSSLIESVTGPAHTVTNTYAADRSVLLSKENKAGETTISKYTYTVNAIGQRSTVSQSGSAFPAATGWNWSYDSLGQVTTAENLTTPANHRAYAYDAIANRQKSVEGNLDPNDSAATTYTANALNQYTAVGTVSPLHDDDGNMTSGQLPAGSGGLVWDAENRLTTVSIVNGDTVHYLYDSQSRRIARTVGTDTTLFVYDSWNVIAEYSSSGSPFTLSKTYLWGTDLSGTNASPAPGQGAGGVGGLLATTDHTGSTPVNHFPTFDGNGNISEYLDFTGTIAAHFEYDPFGNTIVNTDTTNQFAYRFSTKPIDSTTGLYYYGYRWYDPATGRWPSRDPIEERGGVNLYSFISNNTVNTWDVLGLCPPCEDCEAKYDACKKPIEDAYDNDMKNILDVYNKMDKAINDGIAQKQNEHCSGLTGLEGWACRELWNKSGDPAKGVNEAVRAAAEALAGLTKNQGLAACDSAYVDCTFDRMAKKIAGKCK